MAAMLFQQEMRCAAQLDVNVDGGGDDWIVHAETSLHLPKLSIKLCRKKRKSDKL